MHSYTPVPNSLFDTLLPSLKPAELKILLIIIRKTVGWHKPRDWITQSQFMALTGLSNKAVSDALTALEQKGLITISDAHHQPLKEPQQRRTRVRKFYALTGRFHEKSTRGRVQTGTFPRKIFPPAMKKVRPTKETITKENLQRIQKIKAELNARWGRS